MGALFYEAFGGRTGVSITELGNSNTRLFRNFQPYLYWSGTVYTHVGNSSWSFSFGNGFEGTNLNPNAMYVLPTYPVHPAVPAPVPPNSGIGVAPAVAANPSLAASAKGQTVYDRALGISWLADGDLAATATFGVSGINRNGSMSWQTAQQWLAAMNAKRYLGRSDWRLPRTPQPDPTTCSITTPKLHQSSGYNCTGSEMGELFYTELGSEAGSSLPYTHDPDANLFRHVQPSLYWSQADTQHGTPGAWTFSFGNGFQGSNFFSNALYVIPVFDGIAGGPSSSPTPAPAPTVVKTPIPCRGTTCI